MNDSNDSKVSLLWVAVHEIGHALGLPHSYKRGAVMYAWYKNNVKGDFNLTSDDIQKIQSIYGKYYIYDKNSKHIW